MARLNALRLLTSAVCLAGLASAAIVPPASYPGPFAERAANQKAVSRGGLPPRLPGNAHDTINDDGRHTVEFRRGQFTKLEQDGQVCPTRGEKQWTGTVDVTDDRRLFYWFFDSRNDPANDPVILWFNGYVQNISGQLDLCMSLVNSSVRPAAPAAPP